MYLNNIDVEVVILLKKYYMYPKTRQAFFECLKEIEKDPLNLEKVLSKSRLVYRTISEYYRDISDEKLNNILNSIL